jgi:hypothetical protein
MLKRLALLLPLLLVSADFAPWRVTVAAVAYTEKACSDDLASCHCNETFNSNSFTLIDASPTWVDDNLSAKPCSNSAGGSNGWFNFPDTDGTPAGVDPDAITGGDAMPSGHSVDYVLEGTDCGLCQQNIPNVPNDTGIRRVCVRNYRMEDTEDVYSGACNHKAIELHPGDCQIIESQQGGPIWKFSSGGVCSATDEGQAKNEGTGNLDYDDCIGHWCRHEFCAYGDIFDLDGAGGTVKIEGYISRIDGSGLQQDYDWDAGDVKATGSNNFNDSIGTLAWKMWTQDCEAPHSYYSHIMAKTWTSDSEGVFIGCAEEIEGVGC